MTADGNRAESIRRKALELGFSNVGFAQARDYPEYEREVRSRLDYDPFAQSEDSLLIRLARAKTLHPWAQSVVCATLGFSDIHYPENLLRSVARIYLARIYSPQPGTVHRFQIDALANHIEGLGIRIERDQFCLPQRIACAEAGVVTLGNNNFAYTEQDGSFCVLVTFLVDADLTSNADIPAEITNACPSDCTICMDACPTHAILAPQRLNLDRCILFNNQRFQPGAQQDIWDKMGLHIHGCDICQVVCPRNKKPLKNVQRKDPFLELLTTEFDLEKILVLDDSYYKHVVEPIMHNYIKDPDIFRRNAAIALGNSGDPAHVPALRAAQDNTDNPFLLEALDWAISRLEQA